MQVYRLLENSARKWPDRPAVADERGEMTYAELWREVDRARDRLRQWGIQPGQALGLAADNGRGFIAAAFAIIGCGAAVMPISRQLHAVEREAMLEAAPLHAILDESPARGAEPARQLEIEGASPLAFQFTGAPRDKPFVGFVDDAAYVRFTSGTTGAAKGVIVTNAGVVERVQAANRGLGLGPDDTIIWVLPMAYHFLVSIVLYLSAGCRIALCKDMLAKSILETANRYPSAWLYASPLHFSMLAADASGVKFETLRHAISTSIALPRETFEAFSRRFGMPVSQAYGIIELGLPFINLERPRELPGSVGRPLPDYQAAILDENLEPLGVGEMGQLGIRGPGMFSGYLNPPRPVGDVLQNGWFLTGDLARQDEDGYISILGRKKSVINVAGHKVFPEEIETVLNSHPRVAKSRVTAKPHPRLFEIAHAEVVLDGPEPPLDAETLISYCRKRLSAFKSPQSLVFVAAIEETDSGKTRHA